MEAAGTFVSLGILWFLITLFTDSIDSEASFREAWIVYFGVAIVGIPCRLILADGLEPLAAVGETAALYFLVGKVCETDRRTTMKICGWYLLGTLVVSGISYAFIPRIS